MRDDVSHLGRDRLAALRHVLLEQLPLSVRDVADRRGRHPSAFVGEDAVRGRYLEQREVGRAKRHAEVDVDRAGHAEPTCHLHRAVDADPLLQLHGHDVDRFLDRLLQRRRAAELAIIVFGLPHVAAADRVRDRRVVHAAGRREARFQRGDVDEGLEGGAGLAPCLHGAIEFTPEEVVAADERAHITGRRLEGDDSALGMLARLRCLTSAFQGFEPVAQGLLGGELHGRIERAVDVEAALEHHVRAVFRLESLLDVVEEILAGAAPPLRGDQSKIRAREPLRLVFLQRAEVHHAAQDDLSPPLGGIGVVERRVCRRRAWQAGE